MITILATTPNGFRFILDETYPGSGGMVAARVERKERAIGGGHKAFYGEDYPSGDANEAAKSFLRECWKLMKKNKQI